MPHVHSQYVDKDDLKGWLGLAGDAQDTNLDIAINAACRAIDDYCGRVFFQTQTTETRYFDCEFADYVFVDDIATTTGLEVKTLNEDGTDDQTLVLNTDYYLYPLNQTTEDVHPRLPYYKIVMAIENGGKVLPTHFPRSLKITATFGFPVQETGQTNTVPEAVTQAALIQAARFWQRKNSPMGFSGNPETGQAPIQFLSELDPDVKTLIKHFKISTITLASGRPYTGLTAINNQRQYGV